MSDIDTNGLIELATNALERTAFVLVDPAESTDPAELTRHARINYTGEGTTGEVSVSASDGFIVELASSLLGVEPSEIDADVDGADAMRELANILAGSILTTIGGVEHAYRMGLPETTNSPAQTGDGVTCAMDSMGEPLVISWRKAA